MIQALTKIVTFEEFVNWLPDSSDVRYELHHGEIVKMAQPVGDHEEVKGFLGVEIPFEIKRMGLSYVIPNQVIDSGYFPDLLVLNRDHLANEPLWKKQSVISNGISIPLIIEIVSTNWRDDYYVKYADYEEMGISEYWIVDYAALGGRNFIGNPKQPTISVCNLVDEEYQISRFRDDERVISQTFPELNLTANQILKAGMM